MKELLECRNRALALDEITDKQWAKLTGETRPGYKVELIWIDMGKDFPERGYIFTLPMCSFDEADVFVHIPHPQSLGGKDAPEEVYAHMQDLLTNEMVESIVCREN